MGLMDSLRAAFTAPAKEKSSTGHLPPPPPRSMQGIEDLPLNDSVDVVGESNYQTELRRLGEWTKADGLRNRFHQGVVEFEPTNPHDSKAIKVTVDNVLVGYIAKSDHRWMAPKLRKVGGIGKCEVVLMGGQDKKLIGVYLR